MTIQIAALGFPQAIALEFARGLKGDEGFKGLTLGFDFSKGSSWNFKSALRECNLDVLASVFFDNSKIAQPSTLTFATTGHALQIPAYSQGVLPIFTTPGFLDFNLQSTAASGQATLIFMNKEQLPLVWACI